MNTTEREKTIKELFVGECWGYLRKNFSKFNQTNKIKIALELCKKDIPQEVKGSYQITQMPVIQMMISDEAHPIKLEYKIGASPFTKDTGYPPETNTTA